MSKHKSGSEVLSETQRKSWKAFFITSHLMEKTVNTALDQAGLGAQSEYDLLYTLAQAPEQSLTLKEIAASMTLSHSGLSRMVDRLQAQGFVERSEIASDKRAVGVSLLPAGKQRVERVWEVMSIPVSEHFGNALSEKEHTELFKLMSKILTPLIEATEQESGMHYLHRP